MNELLTGLNGGSVPTLELIYLLTLVALLPSIGSGGDCFLFDFIYHDADYQ